MSFYVTLPSNSSIKYFPNNTCTNYITKIKNSIQLDGQYEVALSEITLPFNWSAVIDGGFIVHNLNVKTSTQVKVHWYIDQSINEIIDYINKEMSNKKQPIKFAYKMQSFQFSVIIPNDFALEFIGSTGKELGFTFKYAEGSTGKQTFIAQNPVSPQLNKISTIYCYSDIIDHQFVGDSYSPLLRTIAVPNNLRYGDSINHCYIQPHYIPVCRNTIDTIEIDLRSDTGEVIHFISGKVVIKLHFRQKRFF